MVRSRPRPGTTPYHTRVTDTDPCGPSRLTLRVLGRPPTDRPRATRSRRHTPREGSDRSQTTTAPDKVVGDVLPSENSTGSYDAPPGRILLEVTGSGRVPSVASPGAPGDVFPTRGPNSRGQCPTSATTPVSPVHGGTSGSSGTSPDTRGLGPVRPTTLRLPSPNRTTATLRPPSPNRTTATLRPPSPNRTTNLEGTERVGPHHHPGHYPRDRPHTVRGLLSDWCEGGGHSRSPRRASPRGRYLAEAHHLPEG